MVIMKIEKKNIDTFKCSEIEGRTKFVLSNSIIEILDFDLFMLDCQVSVENCIIRNFLLHSAWFKQGLVLRNNHFLSRIEYYMGGHNEVPIIIHNNIFNDFVDFNDCIFINKIDLQHNVFKKGTNLLGNINDATKNTFEGEVVNLNNVGRINLDGWG